jgi:putative flippase GtrA
MSLAVIYALLAVIATVLNIAAQHLVVDTYTGPYSYPLSLAFGTGVGLVAKYILDKRYIFRFKARDLVDDGQTFALYAFMGIFTTAIFWGVESLFEYLFHDVALRYTGGIIGLAIGYFTKYQLDKRYVFGRSPRAVDNASHLAD